MLREGNQKKFLCPLESGILEVGWRRTTAWKPENKSYFSKRKSFLTVVTLISVSRHKIRITVVLFKFN